MYTKCTKEEIYTTEDVSRDEAHEVNIQGTELVCIPVNGNIYRKMKSGFWKRIENKQNHNMGYNVILVNKKQYMRAKLILFCLNKINLETRNVNIYHINGDRLDCKMDNLSFQIPAIINTSTSS